jgi:hypothetical protein
VREAETELPHYGAQTTKNINTGRLMTANAGNLSWLMPIERPARLRKFKISGGSFVQPKVLDFTNR